MQNCKTHLHEKRRPAFGYQGVHREHGVNVKNTKKYKKTKKTKRKHLFLIFQKNEWHINGKKVILSNKKYNVYSFKEYIHKTIQANANN